MEPRRRVETLSWRTGKRAKGALAVPSPHSLNLNFGSGSLTDRLSARKAYIDLVDANLSSRPNAARHSSTDTGHNYTKLVTTVSGGRGFTGYVRKSDGSFSHGTGFVDLCVPYIEYVPSPIPLLTTGSRTIPTGMTVLPWNQRSINAAANNMAIQPTLPIAETIVELLSGNIPSMIKSLSKRLSHVQRLKQSGADYLSIQFAWKPLVSDAIKVIETLLAADHVVHGQKFRRSRIVREEFQSSQYVSKGTSYRSFLNARSGSAGSYQSNGQVLDYGHRLSHRITARLNNGARATRKQYGFYDKAMDLLFDLGFQDPSLGWELSRFSWLIDWAVDIGTSIDLVGNFSSQTGRYPLDYSYISTKSTTTVVANPKGDRIMSRGASATLDYKSITSPGTAIMFAFDRQPLSLFRPGFSLSGLNGFQYSILVALGLAKSR